MQMLTPFLTDVINPKAYLSSNSNPALIQHSNCVLVAVTDLSQNVLLWHLQQRAECVLKQHNLSSTAQGLW